MPRHLPKTYSPQGPLRLLASCAALALLSGLSSCSSNTASTTSTTTTTTTPSTAATTQWVVGWGASPQNAKSSTSSNPGGSEQSFRFIVLPTIDGTEERVHFSNVLGLSPVTIGAARLAVAANAGPGVDSTRDVPLTFNGSTSVTIQGGDDVVSDPVKLTYAYGEELAVSAYFKGAFGALTQTTSAVQTNFNTAVGAGNTTTDTAGTAFTKTNTEYNLLTGVDVYGSYQGTVAIFGSSTVVGHASDYGDTNSYPTSNVAVPGQDNDRPTDWLARYLLAGGYRMGVLNAGVIADPAGEDGVSASGQSIAGVDRLKRDVLQQAGIKTVVLYIGDIDIRNDCDPATQVEASLTNLVQQANAAGVRVILATLAPAQYCQASAANLLPSANAPYGGDLNPGPENPGSAQNRMLNDWIRTSGAKLPGVVGVADFYAVLADPAHPDFLLPYLNSGDNTHPNGIGYGLQSAAIPLADILGQ